MNVLQVIAVNNSSSNGVAEAVKKYIKYESKYANIALLSLRSEVKSEHCNYFSNVSIGDLDEPFNKPDIVIFNEVYKKEYIKLYKYCLDNKIPYIIIPHGSLHKCAQRRKYIKKKLGNLLLFNSFINNASSIQFLNEKEKNNSIKVKNSCIYGNGVDTFESNLNNPEGKKIVYIGRYDIKTKGLDLMLKMVKDNINWFRDNYVKLDLYGRGDDSHIEWLKEFITVNAIDDIVSINAAVYDEDKTKILKSAYAFIQTSRHEAQPMGIMEAMSYGLPCIVTEGTSFADVVNEYKCGYGAKTMNDVFDGIKLLSDNLSIRNKYSMNAFECAVKYFDCSKIAKRTIEYYNEMSKKVD